MSAPVITEHRADGVAPRLSIGARPALDGLRAIAVLAVVAYHLRYGWATGGFLGVDLFMVLSGFLITSLLLVEHEVEGRISLRRFWIRRFRRILPAVVLVLLAVSATAPLWATVAERNALRGDGIASLTFWANWRFISTGSGYWAQFGSSSPLTHFWSLAVEEQFYVIWPPVVIGALWIARNHRAWLLAGAVGGVIGSALLMMVNYDAMEPSRAYLGTDTRLHTLLIGAVGAILLRPSPDRAVPGERLIASGGVGAMAVMLGAMAVVGDQAAWMYRGGFLVYALVALAVVAAAICSTGPVAALLQQPVLGWIGRRSFGIYLWHWPLIVILTPDRLGLHGLSRDGIVVTATLLIAAGSYRFLERPIRAWSASVPQAVMATASATVLTVAVVVTTTTIPVPDRVELDPIAAVERPEPVVDSIGQPGSGSPDSHPVVTVVNGRDDRRILERVLIHGDSVALFSALPVVEAFAAAGVDAVNLTAYGQSLARPEVLEAVSLMDAQVSIWQISLWDVGDEETQRGRYQAFVDASLTAGMDVVFIDQPPVLESLETQERSRLKRIVRELAAAAPDRVTVLDPEPVWGRSVERDRDGDGVPERWADEIHVCPQGAARWTAWLLAELALRYRGVQPADAASWVNGAWLDDPRWQDSPGQCDPV